MRSFPFSWTSTLTKLGFRRFAQKQKSCTRTLTTRRLWAEPLEDRRMLAVITVDSELDNFDPNGPLTTTDGMVTLREAVLATNLNSTVGDAVWTGTDEIGFSAAVDGDTITLNQSFGELVVSGSLKIDGSGLTSRVTIDANDPTPNVDDGSGIRIFFIDDTTNGTDPPDFEIDSLQLVGGDVSGVGGAIRSEGTLTVRNSLITGNNATGNGGAIDIAIDRDDLASRNILGIYNSTIEDNGTFNSFYGYSYASGDGGAVRVRAGQNGATTTQTITISDSSISGNGALSGGGLDLDIDSATNVSITNSEISGNGATSGSGGGVRAFVSGGGTTITVADSSIDSNYGYFGSGGGIYLNASGSGNALTVTNSSVSGNRAGTGGGLHMTSSSDINVAVSDSQISGNVAAFGSGGGIHAQMTAAGANLSVQDSEINDNHAGGSGGGVYISGIGSASASIREYDFSGTTIAGNTANSIGGGISARLSNNASFLLDDSVLRDNHANSHGGGLSVFFAQPNDPLFDFSDPTAGYPEAGVSVSDSILANNSSGADGGGARLDMGGEGLHNTAISLPLTVERTVISGNEAVNRGGGLYLYGAGGAQLSVVDSRVTGNEAGSTGSGGGGENPRSGGGIYAYTVSGPRNQLNTLPPNDSNPLSNSQELVARITIAGSTIDGNEADLHGGGVAICVKRGGDKSGELAVSNTTITGNVAGDQPEEGHGGGVFLAVFESSSEAEGLLSEFRNVTVTENTAGKGGGIYSKVPTFAGSSDPFQPPSEIDTRLYNTIVAGNGRQRRERRQLLWQHQRHGIPIQSNQRFESVSHQSRQQLYGSHAKDADSVRPAAREQRRQQRR